MFKYILKQNKTKW